MNFRAGDTVGGYEILGVLGAGGMGEVYKVRNLISDRVDAMKVLLADLQADQGLAGRFVREIKVQARLDHPNIASLYTAFEHQGQLVMILEWIEGQTLSEKLRAGPLALTTALGYACQALAALDYAHQRQVIHRDIKPANIMVTAAGRVKLMDFGIAKAVSDKSLTMTGSLLGSLHYMSPEQVRGGVTLDARSDVYSLGVVLYEMAAGRKPFDGQSEYSIMRAHLEESPVPPAEIDPAVPASLDAAILTALEKDPARRFQSATEFRETLERVSGELEESGHAPALEQDDSDNWPRPSPPHSPGTSTPAEQPQPDLEETSWPAAPAGASEAPGPSGEAPGGKWETGPDRRFSPPGGPFPEHDAPDAQSAETAQEEPAMPPAPRQGAPDNRRRLTPLPLTRASSSDAVPPFVAPPRSKAPLLVGAALGIVLLAFLASQAPRWFSIERETGPDSAAGSAPTFETPGETEAAPTGTQPKGQVQTSARDTSPAGGSARKSSSRSSQSSLAAARTASQGAPLKSHTAMPAPKQPSKEPPSSPRAEAAAPRLPNTAAPTPSSALTPDLERVYEPGEVDTPPQLVDRVPPQYTEAARQAGVQGSVRLEAEIWPDGRAHNIRVVRSVGDAGLDQNAVAALSQWYFAPGIFEGQPVKVRALVDINFRLQGGRKRPGLANEPK